MKKDVIEFNTRIQWSCAVCAGLFIVGSALLLGLVALNRAARGEAFRLHSNRA